MSLSRSPSPREGGGWSSPGLTHSYVDASGKSSPNGQGASWESAKRKTAAVNGGHATFASQNSGFFNRHIRNISNSLPTFHIGGDHSYAEKEKLGRGRWAPSNNGFLGRVSSVLARMSRKLKMRLLIVLGFLMAVIIFYETRKSIGVIRFPG